VAPHKFCRGGRRHAAAVGPVRHRACLPRRLLLAVLLLLLVLLLLVLLLLELLLLELLLLLLAALSTAEIAKPVIKQLLLLPTEGSGLLRCWLIKCGPATSSLLLLLLLRGSSLEVRPAC